jgi:two-component system sensor histidine kinase BaeS
MKAILTDLRALSLADAPLRPEGAVERTNLSLVTAEAVEILTALGEASGVRVVSDVATDVIVRADRARLQQVLFNLGENAIKYSSEGDIVTVTLKGGAAEAVLIVGDTGSGISPEDLPHIFDRFYRGKTARGQVSGSGLGLAIARRIVEGQGGAITVDSTAMEGTRFTVRWPTTRER